MKSKARKPKKHNRTFYETHIIIHKTIIKLFKKNRGRITACQVAKAAGITRQTIYYHHSNINQAIVESEEYLLDKFTSQLDSKLKMLTKIIKDRNGRIFYAIFIFMARYRDIFVPICSDLNNQELLYHLMDVMYPKLEIKWLPEGMPEPERDSLRVEIYLNNCVGIIREWGKNTNCNIKKSSKYINSLLRATVNAAQNRLI